ncbi:hypothetical protein B0J17DRAFT_676602 [Rhizoctonia solani]|nr:hypothetical protein B0J17DRAFT_676602 [Rhizoctonia solani]
MAGAGASEARTSLCKCRLWKHQESIYYHSCMPVYYLGDKRYGLGGYKPLLRLYI